VSDGAGGAIVVYVGSVQDPNVGFSIFAKHILACGGLDPTWPSSGVPLTSMQADIPVVAPDGTGGIYVAWQNAGFGAPGNVDIYAQHLLGTGVVDPAWQSDGLPVCTAPEGQSFPKIAADGANGAYVAWFDGRVPPLFHTFVQHLLPSGVDPVWTVNGVQATSTGFSQGIPEVCSDGAGGVIVAWGENRRVGTMRDIFAQRMSSSGSFLWGTTGARVTGASGNQDLFGLGGGSIDVKGVTQEQGSALMPDGSGGCFVTWADQRSGNVDVYAQRLISTGAAAPGWDANGVALTTAAGNQLSPLIVSDGSGGVIATWAEFGNNSVASISTQHVSASGAVDRPANGLAVIPSATMDYLHTMISDGSHGAILAWQDLSGGSNADDVFAQHVVTSGALAVDPVWPVGGAAVMTAAGFQSNSGSSWMARDGSGGFLVVAQDARDYPAGDHTDLYAQRVQAGGTLPQFALTGRVTASCGSGLNGVAVDAYLVGSGDLVGTGVSNSSGAYSIPGLCWGGSYTVTVVTPLDYAATAQDLPANSCASSADFGLTCVTATGTPQSMGYWKHEVGVATGGNGHGQLSPATLCSYLDLIAVHFNNNALNPVIVYQPPASGTCADKLQVARVLLDLQGNAAMIARARQMLMSLLLNVAAGNISQTHVISADGATVSQAITYCDNVIDSPTGNYERAKSIADDVNNGVTVPAGWIPLTTAQIAYRRGMEGVSFRAMPGAGGATRNFQFMTGARGPVSLRIFDVSGRLVAELYHGTMEAGPHSVSWNGRTSSGAGIARGLYFARLQTPRESPTIKVLELSAAN